MRFGLRKRALSGSESYVAGTASTRIVIELLRITVPPLLFALGSAWFLLILEIYLPTIRIGWVPFPLWHLADNDAYATFLGTISGIGGVLIGLYYAGLTAVSSTAYAQAPGVARSLLLREPVGRLYIRLLAYVTFLALCLLAFYAVGFSPIRLGVPFLIVLSGVTILSFVQLGQHAFYFFDPTRLGRSIFTDLERWVKRATADSRFWADPSFQSHAHFQADSGIRALISVADYSSGQKQLRTDSIADLAAATIGFLYRYQSARQRIPSDSKWYPSDYEHPDFYAAGDLKVQFAAQTGGSVEPTGVPEPEWVEDACLPVVLRALRTNLEERDEKSVFRVLNAAIEYSGRLGELWEVGSALNLAEKLATAISPDGWSTAMATKDGARWRLGLAEYICLLPIRALIGLATHLDDATRTKIEGRVQTISWMQAKRLYGVGLHRHALPIMEWFRPRLEFERLIEGNQVTPRWYILQILVRDYLAALHKCLGLLLDANDRLFVKWYGDAVAASNHWAAAVILNRQREYLRKLELHFHRFVNTEKDYQSAKVLPDLQGWPTEQAGAFRERLRTLGLEHDTRIANFALTLVAVQRRPDVPDFAGEFIHETARNIIEALVGNDVGHFRGLFPVFYGASIREAIRLLPKGDVVDPGDRLRRFTVATAPILDLMEVTGYSIIVSELRQSAEIWDAARSLWDGYLVDKTKMDFISSVLKTADVPALFSPGELVRIAWRQRIQGLIADVPREDEVLGSAGYGIHVEHRVKHPSFLIQALGVDLVGSFYRGVDVFTAMYFVRLPGNENAASSLRSSGLIEALAHRSRRGSRAPQEGGDEEATD